ncbi:hypothetical protein, partial [Escherichia marmotae]|uniref:hypothetical protein n=1 Tax=Escherichia marmotae TaxID=1499973 RepID=UPI001C6A8B2B
TQPATGETYPKSDLFNKAIKSVHAKKKKDSEERRKSVVCSGRNARPATRDNKEIPHAVATGKCCPDMIYIF